MTDGFEVTGRRVLITGGSSGIGAETARRLIGAGASVAVVGRSRARLETIAAETGATPIRADLAVSADLERVVPQAVAALGGIDVVVNAAARADWMPFESLDKATLDAMVDLNVWAPLRLAQMARPHLLAGTDPVIVMVGSVDAERPSPGAVAYGATKAALQAATVALAKELTPIRVVQVNPGLVDTPMVAEVKADLEKRAERVNLAGRLADPAEIAGLIHYLVSPLGRFANGNVFRVDGGALVMGPFDATRASPHRFTS